MAAVQRDDIREGRALRPPRDLLILLAVIALVSLGWCVLKTGWFIDEVYTYGLANSHEAPFVIDIKGGNLVDTVLTRDDLVDYLTVSPEERFDFVSVWHNQQADVHPPLYYELVNAVSSLVPGSFSKWIALIPNLVIFLAMCVLLSILVQRITDDRRVSMATTALFALSRTGMEMMLYIRMYCLLAFFTVVLALLIERLMRSWSWWLCPFVGITILLGLLTQYYFVFYAFFVCLGFDIWLMRRGEWRRVAIFSLCAFAGVGIFILAWPAVFTHLFEGQGGSVSGGGVLQNLLTLSEYPHKLTVYAYYVLTGMPIGIACLILSLVVLPIVSLVRRRRGTSVELPRGEQYSGIVLETPASMAVRAVVLVLPAFVTFGLAAVISPYLHLRYAYNVCPIFFVLLGVMMRAVLGTSRGTIVMRDAVVIACLGAVSVAVSLISLPQYRMEMRPEYLHREQKLYDSALEPYADSPCVFMDDNRFACITQDIPQLLAFEDFFVTNDAKSAKLATYVKEHGSNDTLVVYVDTFVRGSAYDGDACAHEVAEALGYDEVTWLYGFNLTQTYVLGHSKGGDAS